MPVENTQRVYDSGSPPQAAGVPGDSQPATFRLIEGDTLAVLPRLPSNSVHCVVTSPPYWGLRDYKIEPSVWGGYPGCSHEWEAQNYRLEDHGDDGNSGNLDGTHRNQAATRIGAVQSAFCQRCGAFRGALGLEPTVDLYIEHMVEVFRHVRRVLHPSGTVWLNLGDSYANGTGGDHMPTTLPGSRVPYGWTNRAQPTRRTLAPGIKPKDLLMMPFQVALALQADGWYLRAAMPWIKRNSMPESVEDRPPSAVEYIFLLAKTEDPYYDREAVRIAASGNRGGGRQRAALLGDGRYLRMRAAKDGDGRSARHSEFQPSSRARRNSDWMFQSIEDLYERAYLQGLRDGQTRRGVSSGSEVEDRAPFTVSAMQKQRRPGEEPIADAGIYQKSGGAGATAPLSVERERQGRRCEALPQTPPPISRSQSEAQRQCGGEALSSQVQRESEGKGDGGEGECQGSDQSSGPNSADCRAMDEDPRCVRQALRVLSELHTVDDGSCDSAIAGRASHIRERCASLPEMQLAKAQSEVPGVDAEERNGLAQLRGSALASWQGLLTDEQGDPLAMLVNPQPFSLEMCGDCETCYEQREYRQLPADMQCLACHRSWSEQGPQLSRGCPACGSRNITHARVCACGERNWVSHFATFPERMVEPCILAGTSEHGCCSYCGAPYERILERRKVGDWHPDPEHKHDAGAMNGTAKWAKEAAQSSGARMIANVAEARAAGKRARDAAERVGDPVNSLSLAPSHDVPFLPPQTLGWRPTCSHPLFPPLPVPSTVLDPFAGSGRTGLVVARFGRNFIGIERNPHYVKMALWQYDRLASSLLTRTEGGDPQARTSSPSQVCPDPGDPQPAMTLAGGRCTPGRPDETEP